MTEQLDDAMHSSMRIKVSMAQRMATSSRQRDRVLDPANLSIQLDTFTTPLLHLRYTFVMAANAVGKTVEIPLKREPERASV